MRILLSGASGQMGRVLAQMCRDRGDHTIVCGFCAKPHDDLGFPIYTDLTEVKEEADVLIDFSSPNSLEAVLDFVTERKMPAVLATTGYSPEQIESIRKAAQQVPIVQSGNMSIGINALLRTVEELTVALKGFDIEIIEKHHTKKKDSPSGTAKMLFQAANRGRESRLSETFGRYGNGLDRPSDEVGIHAIRAGNIVGEHMVIYAGTDEVIEVTHRAGSKKIFANGALQAAEFVIGQPAGLYTMADVL